jgi:hypothetical protein
VLDDPVARQVVGGDDKHVFPRVPRSTVRGVQRPLYRAATALGMTRKANISRGGLRLRSPCNVYRLGIEPKRRARMRFWWFALADFARRVEALLPRVAPARHDALGPVPARVRPRPNGR